MQTPPLESTPADRTTIECRPFDRTRSARIARAFLPRHPLGNRHDYFYTLFKLRGDPLYPGVLSALRGSCAPLLDLGCGLGLLAHALRADGQAMPYRGVDIDAAKIARAQRVASAAGLDDAVFEVVDLARVTPAHRGSIAILDVLQYLSHQGQRELLAAAAAMLTPDARLLIRTGLGDRTRRGRITRVTDRFANLIGWMQERPKCYPTAEGLRDALEDAGLRATFAPLYGNTPFNNWLVVARPNG